MSKLRVNEIEPVTGTQVAIGGAPDNDLSSLLKMQSTTQGFSPPRMTTPQRNAIPSPSEGLLVYNTDDHRLEQYSNGTWTVAGNGLSPVTNVLRVVKNPVLNAQDFSSINAALAAVTSPGPSNQWVIEVGPGVFVEDPIHMLPYVYIRGEDFDSSVIEAANPNDHLIYAADFSSITGCQLTGVTLSGKALIYYQSTTGTLQTAFWVEDVRFGHADTIIISEGTLAHTNLFVQGCRFGGIYQFNTGFVARTNSGPYIGRIVMLNTTTSKMTAPFPADVFLCDGVNSEMYIKSVAVRTGTVSSGGSGGGQNGLRIRNGGTIRGTSVDLSGFAKGVWCENVGPTPPFLILSAFLLTENTIDVQIDNPGTTGGMSVFADDTKISVNPATTQFGFNNIGLEDGDVLVSGKIRQNQPDGTFTDISTLSAGGAPLGVFISGDIRPPVSGFTLTLKAGMGYLQKSDGSLRKFTWPETPFTVSASTTTWIYFDGTGTLQGSSIFPNVAQNILIARVVTDATRILIIEDSGFQATHMANTLGTALRNGLGPVYDEGSLVSELGTRTLNITSGDYYLGELNFRLSGGSPVSFTAFHQNGSGGFVSVYDQTVVDNANYDNGSGTLQPISAGQYVKHALYALGDPSGDFDAERYFLVYGQEQFTALTLAEQGSLPNPPNYLNGIGVATTLIAAIIVQQGATHIVEVLDERPLFSAKRVATVAAATFHHNLLGLNDFDDHLRYLPVDGSRSMTGDLPMGTHNVVNAGTYNGVTVENHHARHQPGGADAIPTAAAIAQTPNTGNAEGSSTSLARADHVHNIPTAAPITQGPDNSNADGVASTFSKSDHVHDIPSAAPVQVNANGLNVQGTSSSFARADHKHDILTGVPSTQTPDQINAAGSSSSLARADHVHNIPTAVPSTQGPDNANADGSASSFSRSDHTHNIPTATVSTQTPNQANARGSSSSFARADHAHNIPTGTPSALTPNAGNSQGSAAAFAQQDHIHNIPTAAPANQTIAASATDGSASTFSRSDHTHTFSTATPTDIGSANAAGTSTSFIRADHVHKGVHSVNANGGTQEFGDLQLKNGNGASVTDNGSGVFTVDTNFGANEFVITSTSGLVINYTGGRFVNGIFGTINNIASGSITVSANVTLGYLYVAINNLSGTGTVTASTTPPSIDSIPFATFVSGPSSVTSTTDIRSFVNIAPLGESLKIVYPGSGLSVSYNAGAVRINGTYSAVAAGSLSLSNSIASGAIYVDVSTLLVTANTTGLFPSNCIPLATYTTSGGAVTVLTGARAFLNNNVVFGSSSDIQTLNPNVSNTAGSTNRYADAGHIHNVPTAAPIAQGPDNANADGSASTFSKSDHVHTIPTAAAITQNPDQANAKGTSSSFARADHIHNVPTAAAVTISTNANSQGTSTSFARADHTHQITQALASLDHLPQFDGSNWQAVYPETLSPARSYRLSEDFISGSTAGALNWTAVLTGGASVITTGNTGVSSSNPGVVVITAGNAASRFATLHLGLNTMELGGGALTMECLFQLQTLTNAAFRIGLGDQTAADHNNGVYLEYNSGTSANWLIKTANGATRTTTTTSVAATASAWHKLVISINAAATSVSFTLDGTSLGSITTNIPTTNGIAPNLMADSLGATSTTFWVDYFNLYQRFTTSR